MPLVYISTNKLRLQRQTHSKPSWNPFVIDSLLGCACQIHEPGATFDTSLDIVELCITSPIFPLAYAPKSKMQPPTSSSVGGKEPCRGAIKSEDEEMAGDIDRVERTVASCHDLASIRESAIT